MWCREEDETLSSFEMEKKERRKRRRDATGRKNRYTAQRGLARSRKVWEGGALGVG
jgi:hypothetical protein